MATQKYRIVSEQNNKLLQPTFYIQRKSLFFWRNVSLKENKSSKDLTFSTYEDAEVYMRDKYFSTEGSVFKPSQNEYHYTEFSLYYY